jgi:hypothetical protein
MFSLVIFMDLNVDVATFWEIGQLGSIFASAVVSLILYHFMVLKLTN